MFTAIVGRFLTAYAAWKLESGINVASLEYLLGSRTVFGTLSTPLRLRTLHLCIPILIALWSLSPLGGQASLRIIWLDAHYTNTTRDVTYLNTSSMFQVTGADARTAFEGNINAMFQGAFVSPGSLKRDVQDTYGNLKVPLIESFSQEKQPDESGWYAVETIGLEYSSLLGLPSTRLHSDGKTFANIESSYLYPTCRLSLTSAELNTSERTAWHKFQSQSCNNGRSRNLALQLYGPPGSPYPWEAPEPRAIVLGSFGYRKVGDELENLVSMATCNLKITYVETSYTCDAKSCAPVAIRRSKAPRGQEVPSVQMNLITGNSTAAPLFCSMFINSTGIGRNTASSPLEVYIQDPDVPFTARFDAIVADAGDKVLSQRFAQLLNTYWLAGIAPFAIAGGFEPQPHYNPESGTNSSDYKTTNTTATLQTTETVLVCNNLWLVILLVSSLAMSAAGATTVVLNLLRKGPEILDSFVSTLRDSPYVHTEAAPSTEDGPDKARRMYNVSVMLGDVRPGETYGLIAVAADTGAQPIERLERTRRYV